MPALRRAGVVIAYLTLSTDAEYVDRDFANSEHCTDADEAPANPQRHELALLHVRSVKDRLLGPALEPVLGPALGPWPAAGASIVFSNQSTVDKALDASLLESLRRVRTSHVSSVLLNLSHAERWKKLYIFLMIGLAMIVLGICTRAFCCSRPDGYVPPNAKAFDSMTYHTEDLVSWTTLFQRSLTVWQRPTLWMVAVRWLALAAVIAVLVAGLVPNAGSMHIDRLAEISGFLNAFVGLLLGFFMAASVNRWWACADGFLMLFDAIRNLQMQLLALGVDKEKLNNCIRFGVISVWILQTQLKMNAKHDVQRDSMGNMWKVLETGEGMDPTFGKLSASELDLLRDIHDPASLLWTWVASYIGRLAEDGIIPAMHTPTYGRIMQQAEEAHCSIRKVRSSLIVQAPYIYVHLLASLVHLNNVVNAISFGIAWGASLEEAHRLFHKGGPGTVGAVSEEASADVQQMLVSFFYSCFGPFIYQAMLEVGIVIAEPFSSDEAEIPTARLLRGLEKDLHDGIRMAASTAWERPRFGG